MIVRIKASNHWRKGSLLARQTAWPRSEEHTSELQSRQYLVCRLLLEKKTNKKHTAKDHNSVPQFTCVHFPLAVRLPHDEANDPPVTDLDRTLTDQIANYLADCDTPAS